MSFGRLFVMLAGLFMGFARFGMADCSLSLPCGQCNSGSFNATCQCHDGSGFQCTGCTGTCLQGGCCCGNSTNPPFSKSCSSASCGGTTSCTKLTLPGGQSPSLIASSSNALAGLALTTIGRVQESNQAIPGTVSSANAPIEVDVPLDAAIEITNVKLSATSNKFDGGSFTIKNVSDKDLIAYSLVMNLYFDTSPDHPMEMRVTEDGWFLNQYVLKPGESKEGVIRTSLTSKNPVKLTHVTVVPDYIEFSGGEASGANVSMIGAALTKSRNIEAELLRTYSAKLQAGQPTDSVVSLFKSDLQVASKGGSAYQVGMNILSAFLNFYGSESFAKKCTEALATRAY